MLIRGYGEYWSPQLVAWGERGREKGVLPGVARPDNGDPFDVDVWQATAVYVLWSDYQPVYIGKATANRGLGPRMRDHLADRLGDRWDLFSWYSLSKPLRSGRMNRAGGRHVDPATVLAAFEAFGQRLDLPLNRRQESLPGAIRVDQEPATEAVTALDIMSKLEQLERKLEAE